MKLTKEQIATVGQIILNTCSDMSIQDINLAQRALELECNRNPDATRDDLINAAREKLIENTTSNIMQCMMLRAFGRPNNLQIDFLSAINHAFDMLEDEELPDEPHVPPDEEELFPTMELSKPSPTHEVFVRIKNTLYGVDNASRTAKEGLPEGWLVFPV